MMVSLSLWRTSLGTIMKLLLCIAFLLLAAQLSESGCIYYPRNASSAMEQPNSCIDIYDGASYPVGETWLNARCMRCTCSVDALTCCPTYSLPTRYSEDCTSVFNHQWCRYRVYRKDNPAIEYEVHGGVG